MVFGIAVDEPQAVVQDFVKQFQLTYPVLVGTQTQYNQYRIAGSHVSPYPRDFVIGRDGTIVYASDEYDPEAMQEAINHELNPTGVEAGEKKASPATFLLQPVYPNPFHISARKQSTRGIQITYRLQRTTAIQLQVFDAVGRLVRTLALGQQPQGDYFVAWDGKDAKGGAVPPGIYFIRLKAGPMIATRKFLILR